MLILTWNLNPYLIMNFERISPTLHPISSGFKMLTSQLLLYWGFRWGFRPPTTVVLVAVLVGWIVFVLVAVLVAVLVCWIVFVLVAVLVA